MTSPQHGNDKRVSGWMWIGFWLLLLVLLGFIMQNQLDKDRNPNQNLTTALTSEGVKEVALKRNRYGHYNLTGEINGDEVEFLLDTGATDISIPASVADKMGLQRLQEVQFYTANGIAKGYLTKVDEVRVGEIVLRNLRASINPNVSDDTVLLGMSFLKKIEFTQRGDTLILRQY